MAKLKVGFIPIEGGHFYKDALEEVVRAEDLGFDSVWMEEHHSVVNHYWPSPLPVLAGFATRTSRVLLGTDILVAPFYHPARLAEDAAMIDVMSAGRFVLGAAIGYKPDEFALYGAELEKRGARFEEQLAIIKGLWTQESLAFNGRYYRLEGKLEPKPVAKPHPPIWIGGWGDITLRRAATLADNWIPGPTADLKRLRPRILSTLDAGFFRARYVRASPNERKLMRNIATFGESATIEQLQQASGKRNNEIQPTISALIAKGLVYRPERARIGFTAPMFGAFLQRTPG